MTHATRAAISPVEPSAYVPVAVNCRVEPIAKLTGEAGSILIENKVGVVADVGVDVDVAEQDAMTMVKVAINPMVRRKPINRSCFLFIIISSSSKLMVNIFSPAVVCGYLFAAIISAADLAVVPS
jgi:hypothetical protein